MKLSLSVVIPAYNEEAGVGSCLEKVSSVLKQLKITDSEIILVNDGSKDRTGEIAKSYLRRLPNLKIVENRPNRGYGGSLRSGFDVATKEFIAFVPADNQFDFSEVVKLIAKQQETEADIVSGIRVGGGVDPLPRRINRFGWNMVIRVMFGFLATDIDCGFKLFRRRLLDRIHLTAERGAMIDTQFLASAKLRGYTISEVPVTHLPRLGGASTGANPRVIIQSFIDLFKFWWQLQTELRSERVKK